MGILDKAINKTKSSINTSSTKVAETKEVSTLEAQMKEEKSKVRDLYEDLGQEYYRFTVDKDDEHKKNMLTLIDKINESRKIIEDCEAQIEDVRDKYKEERENIKAEAEARDKEIDEADEQARAEKEAAKKEKEDLF